LVLARDQVPFCMLGGLTNGPRLGWTSWLKTGDFNRDDDQVLLSTRS
jgi:predicted component of type VI protein secretion system